MSAPNAAESRRPSRLTSRPDFLAALLLCVITGLGAYLRLRTLGAEDLWVDEALTLTYGSRPLAALWLAPADPTPPLYYTLHHLLIGYSDSPAVVRSLSAAAGIVSVPVMYVLGRSIHGKRIGLAAALFLAVSGPHIQHSQEARAYALLFLLILLSSVCLSESLRRREQREGGAGLTYAGFVCFAALGVYTHYVALLWVASAHIALAAVMMARFSFAPPVRHLLRGALVGVLAVLPALWMMKAAAGWSLLSPLDIGEFFSLLRRIVLVRERWPGHAVGEAFLMAAAVAGLVLARNNGRAVTVLVTFILFPILLWSVQAIKPVMMFRTALLAVVGPLLLFAFAMAPLRRGVGLAAGLAIAGVLAASHFAFEGSAGENTRWAAAAAQIEARGKDGDVIVLCASFTYPSLRYYLEKDVALPILGLLTAERAARFPAPADEVESWNSAAAKRSYGGQRDATALTSPSALAAEQRSGSRGWVVEAHCSSDRRRVLDAFLAAMAVSPTRVWEDQGIAIERIRF